MRGLVLCLLLPATLAAAAPRTLVYRYLHVGRALGQYDLTTYTLRLDGAAAELTIEHAATDPKQRPDQLGPYLVGNTEQLTGTVTRRTDGLDLAFTGAPEPLRALACRTTRVQVARSDALRVKTPGEHGECDGDRGVWAPAKTTAMSVLSCGTDDALVFGASPGIERAGLSEECYLQGAGLRAIRPDGKVTLVSPKRR